jgi:hypothetical protein
MIAKDTVDMPAVEPLFYTVKVQYFRMGGKYYTEGEYSTTLKDLHEIHDDFRKRIIFGNLPGLTSGSRTPWIIVLNVPGHPHEHPRIFFSPMQVTEVFKAIDQLS